MKRVLGTEVGWGTGTLLEGQVPLIWCMNYANISLHQHARLHMQSAVDETRSAMADLIDQNDYTTQINTCMTDHPKDATTFQITNIDDDGGHRWQLVLWKRL